MLVLVAALAMLASLVANAAVSYLSGVPQTAGQPQPFDWIFAGMLAGSLLVVVVMWRFADFFAGLAQGRREDPVFESGIDVAGWQAIAFATVGAYFAVVHGLGLARSALLRFAERAPWALLAEEQQRQLVAFVVTDALGLAVGLGLVLGARGLAAALHRLRYGRTPTG